MILFSNGCSFLTTRPKDGVDTYCTKILADSYNMALCNYAMGGRGNDRISFTTKVWLERHKRDKHFAVIGWSSQNRNDYVTNDGHKKGRPPQTDLKVIRDAINMDRFFSPNISHYEYIIDKGLVSSQSDPHPSAEGHRQWAEKLKDFIDANNLRTI